MQIKHMLNKIITKTIVIVGYPKIKKVKLQKPLTTPLSKNNGSSTKSSKTFHMGLEWTLLVIDVM